MGLVFDPKDPRTYRGTDPKETLKYIRRHKPKPKQPVAPEEELQPEPEEPQKEYTPAQATAISKFQQARERYFTSLRRRRYDPTRTYYEPVRWDEHGKPVQWRHVKGADIIRDIDKGYSEHWKSQTLFRREVKQYHPKTKLRETKEGYDIIPPSSLEWSEKQLKGIEKADLPPVIKELSLLGFYGGQTVVAAGQPLKGVFDVISGKPKKHWTYTSRHHVSLIDYLFEPVGWSPKGSTKLLERHPIEALIGGGLAEIPVLFAYGKALKPVTWVGKKALKPITTRLPSVSTYLSGVSKAPGYKYITNIKSMMGGYKGKYADIRFTSKVYQNILKGATGQSSYGKIPGYMGRLPFGKKGFVSTLEQMRGTLFRSGWRGGDPLKAAAWSEYYSYLTQPKLAKRMLSAIKYNVDLTGVSVSRVYDVKWALPKLATGQMPYQYSQIPVKISGYKKGTTQFDFLKPDTSGFKPYRGVDPIVSGEKGISTTTQLRFDMPHMVSKRYLEYLEKLKPPYETYAYPTGTRIGVISTTSTGKIIIPGVDSSVGTFSHILSGSILGEIGKKKPGRKQFIDLKHGFESVDRQISNMLLGTSTSSRTASLSLQGSLSAQGSISKSMLKLKQVSLPKYKSLSELYPGTPQRQRYDYKNIVKIPKYPFWIPPMSLGGRGRRFYGEDYYRKKYKFRKFDVPDLSKMLRGMGF